MTSRRAQALVWSFFLLMMSSCGFGIFQGLESTAVPVNLGPIGFADMSGNAVTSLSLAPEGSNPQLQIYAKGDLTHVLSSNDYTITISSPAEAYLTLNAVDNSITLEMGALADLGFLDGENQFVLTATLKEDPKESVSLPLSFLEPDSLQAWFDAKESSTLIKNLGTGALAADGEVLVQWKDRSQKAMHASPLVDGAFSCVGPTRRDVSINTQTQPVLEFRQADWTCLTLGTTTLNITDAVTVYALFYRDGASAGAYERIFARLAYFMGPPHPNFLEITFDSRIGNLTDLRTNLGQAGDITSGLATTGRPIAVNNWYLAGFSGGPDETIIETNGVRYSGPGVGPIVTTGDLSEVGFMIGTSGNPSIGREESFNGYLAELIVFNKSLSPAERARFREYTAEKWGVSVPEITSTVP